MLYKMKDVLQKRIDNAVSKTINFSQDTTKKDVDIWRFYNYEF